LSNIFKIQQKNDRELELLISSIQINVIKPKGKEICFSLKQIAEDKPNFITNTEEIKKDLIEEKDMIDKGYSPDEFSKMDLHLNSLTILVLLDQAFNFLANREMIDEFIKTINPLFLEECKSLMEDSMFDKVKKFGIGIEIFELLQEINKEELRG